MTAKPSQQNHVQAPPEPLTLTSSRMISVKAPGWVKLPQLKQVFKEYDGLVQFWHCYERKLPVALFRSNDTASSVMDDINSTTTFYASPLDGWCPCSGCNAVDSSQMSAEARGVDGSLNPAGKSYGILPVSLWFMYKPGIL